MRIQLHNTYESTLIALAADAGLHVTDYIKMLILNAANVPHNFKVADPKALDKTCIIKTNLS